MRVNDIFCSLQGEGRYTGTPAVFLRLSGCNLRCSFCDTQHTSYTEMSEDEIVERLKAYAPRHLVITGGEPALQMTSTLAGRLHGEGFFLQMETNGSVPLPPDCRIDWITCSPKQAPVRLVYMDELKVVYQGQDLSRYDDLDVQERRLQPLDTGDEGRNAKILQQTIRYCLEHPAWSLSLQTHKLIGVR